MKKTIYGNKLYYNDESRDDFTDFKANLVRPVDKTYRYESKNPLFILGSFLLYYLIAVPVLWLICRVVHGVRVTGRKHLRSVKGGCVIYSNHVNTLDCAFALVCAAAPRRCYIVCNPDAVHIPFVRHIVKMLGALPVPQDLAAFKNLTHAVDKKLKKGNTLVVMPEAHIWPYYTGIRRFPSTSFTYAAKNAVPAVPICVTYRAPKGPLARYLRPRVTIRICAPVYPSPELPLKENAAKMCESTYLAMVEQSKNNEIALYDYIKTTESVNCRKQIAEVTRAQSQRVAARRHLVAFGKEVYRSEYRHRIIASLSAPIIDSLSAPIDDEQEEAYAYATIDKR